MQYHIVAYASRHARWVCKAGQRDALWITWPPGKRWHVQVPRLPKPAATGSNRSQTRWQGLQILQ